MPALAPRILSLPLFRSASGGEAISPGLLRRYTPRNDRNGFALILSGIFSFQNLQHILQLRPDFSLSQAFRALPHSDQAEIQEQLGSQLSRFLALSQESDPELFFEGLFGLAQSFENQGKLDLAAAIYSGSVAWLRERSGFSLPIWEGRFSSRLNAILGRGRVSLERLEFLGRHFARELVAPENLIPMLVGQGAFGYFRNLIGGVLAGSASTLLTRGAGARLLSNTGAFVPETFSFWASARGLREILHPGRQAWDRETCLREIGGLGVTLGALKLFGAGAGSALRRFSIHPGFSARVLPPLATWGGILVGNHLAQRWGFHPVLEGRSAEMDLVDSLAMLLQFQISGRVMQGFGGSRHFAEFSSHWLERQHEPLRPALAMAGVEAEPSRGVWENIPRFNNIHRMEGVPSEREALAHRFATRFGDEKFSADIIKTALEIPTELKHFHQILLTALSQAANRGTLQQLHTLIVINNILTHDSLNSSTGSFNNALLQLFIGRAVGEGHSQRGLQALGDIFQEMESGLRPEALQTLMGRYGYGQSLGSSVGPRYSARFFQDHQLFFTIGLKDYRFRDRVQIFNFVSELAGEDATRAKEILRIFAEGRRSGQYRPEEIDGALDFAGQHPQGRLVLRRMMNIFASEDVPAKLRELRVESPTFDGFNQISQMLRRGQSPEAVAQEINGTRLTAYIEDMRLARKVVTVMAETRPYLWERTELRSRRLLQIGELFEERVQQRSMPGVEDFLQLLRWDAHPRTQQLLQALAHGKLRIEMVPTAQFAQVLRARKWQEVPQCPVTFFRAMPRGQPSRIYIREMPRWVYGPASNRAEPVLDVTTPMGYHKAFEEFACRAMFLTHEGEHWRHFSGNYLGAEVSSEPISLESRQDRMVSEIMASLDEFGWGARNFHINFWEFARRLGLDLPTYLRDQADEGYFGPANRQRSAALIR